MDKFSIKSLFGAVRPLAFPPYLYFSSNYYSPDWSLRCVAIYASLRCKHRRAHVAGRRR